MRHGLWNQSKIGPGVSNNASQRSIPSRRTEPRDMRERGRGEVLTIHQQTHFQQSPPSLQHHTSVPEFHHIHTNVKGLSQNTTFRGGSEKSESMWERRVGQSCEECPTEERQRGDSCWFSSRPHQRLPLVYMRRREWGRETGIEEGEREKQREGIPVAWHTAPKEAWPAVCLQCKTVRNKLSPRRSVAILLCLLCTLRQFSSQSSHQKNVLSSAPVIKQ